MPAASFELPEERELQAKRMALQELEGRVATRELELVTLREEIRDLQQRYFSTVGLLLVRLDELRAEIARLDSCGKPEEHGLRVAAEAARRRAEDSAAAAAKSLSLSVTSGPQAPPTSELKRLYWEIARRIHPDLAESTSSLTLRTELMAKLNDAYSRRDETEMRAILEEFRAHPDAVDGEGLGQELVRVIRQLSRLQSRLRALDLEEAEILSSEMGRLLRRELAAKSLGRDLIAEIAVRVGEEIAVESVRLNARRGGDSART